MDFRPLVSSSERKLRWVMSEAVSASRQSPAHTVRDCGFQVPQCTVGCSWLGGFPPPFQSYRPCGAAWSPDSAQAQGAPQNREDPWSPGNACSPFPGQTEPQCFFQLLPLFPGSPLPWGQRAHPLARLASTGLRGTPRPWRAGPGRDGIG